MKVRIIRCETSGKFKAQYKLLWWWRYFLILSRSRDMDIMGNEINNDRLEHLTFDSLDEAYAHLTIKTKAFTVVKEFEI